MEKKNRRWRGMEMYNWSGQGLQKVGAPRMKKNKKTAMMMIIKPMENKHLAISRCRTEDNLRSDLKDIQVCVNTRNWIDSAHNRNYWRVLLNAAFTSRFLKLWFKWLHFLTEVNFQLCCKLFAYCFGVLTLKRLILNSMLALP